MFDFYLAPYVALTYAKELAHVAKVKLDLSDDKYKRLKEKLVSYQKKKKLIMSDDEILKLKVMVREFFDENHVKCSNKRFEKIFEYAYNDTYNETYQSMEAFIHNLNTMHCLPASEKIWVFDVKANVFKAITMEELDNTFEKNKYKVISLNKETGKSEFKFITHCKKLDNHRDLVTLRDSSGRRVRVTDNHRVMTIGADGKIGENIPKNVLNVIVPRGIEMPAVKYDICIGDYGEILGKVDHLYISSELAKFIGYYMAIGEIDEDNNISFVTKDFELSTEIEQLARELFKSKTAVVYKTRCYVGATVVKMFKDKFSKEVIPTEILIGPKHIRKAFVYSYLNAMGKKNKLISGDMKVQIEFILSSLGVGRVAIDDGMDAESFVEVDGKKLTYRELDEYIDENDRDELKKYQSIFVNEVVHREWDNSKDEYVYDISVEGNETFLTYEGIFVHNSRAGAQVPFSSINYGTDTSVEGRMVMRALLETTDAGLGNGETPIFPKNNDWGIKTW